MSRPKTCLKIHVNVTYEQDRRMHELSVATGLTISELYRAALDEFLSRVKMPSMQPAGNTPVSPGNGPQSLPVRRMGDT